MIRYTTPTLTLTVDRDLTDCETYITLRQGSREITLESANTECGSTTIILVALTQEQTAAFKANRPVSIQVNWINADGIRKATRQRQIMLGENLLDKEISYGD